MLGLFSYGMQMGAIRASPPSQCNDLLHHTEVYSKLDVLLALFFLQSCFKYTDDTVPCTEYINTPECLYWGDIGEEVYL